MMLLFIHLSCSLLDNQRLTVYLSIFSFIMTDYLSVACLEMMEYSRWLGNLAALSNRKILLVKE